MTFLPCDASVFESIEILPCDLYRKSIESKLVLYGRAGQKTKLFTSEFSIRPENFYITSDAAATLYDVCLLATRRSLLNKDLPFTVHSSKLLSICQLYFVNLSQNFHSIETFSKFRHQFSELLIEMLRSKNLVDKLRRAFLHDEPTYKHAALVCFLSYCFSKRFPETLIDTNALCVGALLHDLGKIRLDPKLINKSSALSAAERRRIQIHPTLSALMLRSAGVTSELILHIVEAHHERDDGTGYPKQLTRESIALEARICRICDVFEALTADRPYRDKMPTTRALSLIRNEICADLSSQFLLEFELFASSTLHTSSLASSKEASTTTLAC